MQSIDAQIQGPFPPIAYPTTAATAAATATTNHDEKLPAEYLAENITGIRDVTNAYIRLFKLHGFCIKFCRFYNTAYVELQSKYTRKLDIASTDLFDTTRRRCNISVDSSFSRSPTVTAYKSDGRIGIFTCVRAMLQAGIVFACLCVCVCPHKISKTTGRKSM